MTVTDTRGRDVDLAPIGVEGEALDGLVGMYGDFDLSHRAQGLPPAEPVDIRDWLAGLDTGLHLVARHDARTVGHAALVPGEEGGHELVIFVHQAYHGARIGTHLLETLLEYAAERGVERVRLTVERRNRPAVALYRKVGFEAEESVSPVVEMRLRLDE